MKRSSAWVTVAALFVAGVVLGVLGTHAYYGFRILEQHGVHPPRGHDPGHFMGHRLDLTPEQRDQIEAILEDSHREAEALRSEIAPRIREHLDRTRARIEEVLTPGQLETFRTFADRDHRAAERFLLGGGRPRKPGGPFRGKRPDGAPPHRPPPPHDE